MKILNRLGAIIITAALAISIIPAEVKADEDAYSKMATTYYYDQLSEIAKIAYQRLDSKCKDILRGVANPKDRIDLSDLGISADDFKHIYYVFNVSNPQYWFLGQNYIYYVNQQGIINAVSNLSYDEFFDDSTRSSYNELFNSEVNKAIETVRNRAASSRPEDLEKAAHDYIAETVAYNENAEYNQSCIGLFATHESVCYGYCKAFQIIMNSLGVQTVTVLGNEHAWNAVNLYGNWYLVDITSDDGGEYGTFYELYNTSHEKALAKTNYFEYFTEARVSYPDPVYDNNPSSRNYIDPHFNAYGNTYFIVNNDGGDPLAVVIADGGNGSPTSVEYDGVNYSIIGASGLTQISAPVRPVIKAEVYNYDAFNLIGSFVDRLYLHVLGREPEEDGAYYWTKELYCFNTTGADAALCFINSPEFINKNTSNERFVEILYKTFFNRDPDQGGFDNWVAQLKGGAMDRLQVASGFIYSQEWADTCARYGIISGGTTKPKAEFKPTYETFSFVERMYTTALGRSYDNDGRSYWAGELANYNTTGENVGAFFFLSDEFRNMNVSDKEFVTRLYRTFMDREPDQGGLDFWLSALKTNSRDSVVFGFTRSDEFMQRCVDARILPF